jgi:hypothetical protein
MTRTASKRNNLTYIKTQSAEVAVSGKTVRVPSFDIDGLRVVVTGTLIKIARIFDEEFMEHRIISDPQTFLSKLAGAGMRADIFTFAESIAETVPKYSYPFDWDNAAVASTRNFDGWWKKLPQETRKNVRRAAKRGLIVQSVIFDDKFVRGIQGIYDEIPIRQGRRFWHYGKDFETIKRENGTYLNESDFIGAFYNEELIGFLKFVRVGQFAVMMQILSKAAHYDKRPMNAMIAKAVEVCQEKKLLYLVYGKFTYGNKTQSQIAEFKHRNGFVQMNYPRYFVPLTMKGRFALQLKLHRGLLALLPSTLIDWLWRLRREVLRLISIRRRAVESDEERL